MTKRERRELNRELGPGLKRFLEAEKAGLTVLDYNPAEGRSIRDRLLKNGMISKETAASFSRSLDVIQDMREGKSTAMKLELTALLYDAGAIKEGSA